MFAMVCSILGKVVNIDVKGPGLWQLIMPLPAEEQQYIKAKTSLFLCAM